MKVLNILFLGVAACGVLGGCTQTGRVVSSSSSEKQTVGASSGSTSSSSGGSGSTLTPIDAGSINTLGNQLNFEVLPTTTSGSTGTAIQSGTSPTSSIDMKRKGLYAYRFLWNTFIPSASAQLTAISTSLTLASETNLTLSKGYNIFRVINAQVIQNQLKTALGAVVYDNLQSEFQNYQLNPSLVSEKLQQPAKLSFTSGAATASITKPLLLWMNPNVAVIQNLVSTSTSSTLTLFAGVGFIPDTSNSISGISLSDVFSSGADVKFYRLSQGSNFISMIGGLVSGASNLRLTQLKLDPASQGFTFTSAASALASVTGASYRSFVVDQALVDAVANSSILSSSQIGQLVVFSVSSTNVLKTLQLRKATDFSFVSSTLLTCQHIQTKLTALGVSCPITLSTTVATSVLNPTLTSVSTATATTIGTISTLTKITSDTITSTSTTTTSVLTATKSTLQSTTIAP